MFHIPYIWVCFIHYDLPTVYDLPTHVSYIMIFLTRLIKARVVFVSSFNTKDCFARSVILFNYRIVSVHDLMQLIIRETPSLHRFL